MYTVGYPVPDQISSATVPGYGYTLLYDVSLNGAIGQICPIQGSFQAKIETTPFKAPPDTLIGIADAPPLGLSRTPRTAVWGAPVVEECPPLCPRSSASGGTAPRPWRWRNILCMGNGHWKFWTMKFQKLVNL